MHMIRLIILHRLARPEPPPFRFDTSEASLQFNKKVLENFGFDLGNLISSSEGNIISPGSEFRDTAELASLLLCYLL